MDRELQYFLERNIISSVNKKHTYFGYWICTLLKIDTCILHVSTPFYNTSLKSCSISKLLQRTGGFIRPHETCSYIRVVFVVEV